MVPTSDAPAWSVTPSEEPRVGLVLLVSDAKCLLCGAPKVYAGPTLGLSVASGGLQARETCMNTPCPAALQALPLLQALQGTLKKLKARR